MNALSVVLMAAKWIPTLAPYLVKAAPLISTYGPLVEAIFTAVKPVLDKHIADGTLPAELGHDLGLLVRSPAEWTAEENERFWNRASGQPS